MTGHGDGQTAVDYKAIVETVPAIVFVCDTAENCHWYFVNEWIEPILGFTAEEWMTSDRIWERQLHPDDREMVIATEAAEVRAAIDAEARGRVDGHPTEDERRGTLYLDYRMLHKDGHVVWIRDSSLLVRTEDGTLLWHGVMLDITDQKLIEEELARQSAAQAAVAQLGADAISGKPIPELLLATCRAATEVLGADAAALSQVGDDGLSMDVRAEVGWPVEIVPGHHVVDPRGPGGQALFTGKPVLIANWDEASEIVPNRQLAAAGIRSSIGVRIEGSARPWGVFGVLSRTAGHFKESDVNFVVALTNILADAIERQDAEDAMQHRALHDVLTGLPNRSLFADRLEQALERVRRHPGTLAAILFIDVDHFKNVNDTLGHQAGDELLVGVATRLREAVRPTDTVARLGGDEFGLLLEEIASEHLAIATAERIAASFVRPFVLSTGSQFVTASIGIALADSHQDAHEFLSYADVAMYQAKERGRDRYHVFDAELRMRTLVRGRTERDLKDALESKQLRLVYQPVVDLKTEQVTAVEALLRWDHPQSGIVMPTEFIRVAEESGLIDRIGQWVLDQALRDARNWQSLLPDRPPIRVAVNVSTLQLQNPRFPETVAEAIKRSGLDPETVSLELDESVLRDEADQMRSTLRMLKRTGIILTVHDFGTGDSSLRQLAALPIDTIKVDRRFVATLGTEDAASPIAHAVIATGAALKLIVIGAGVETRDQVQELRRLGCDRAQGFYYSEGVSAHEIAALLARGGSLRAAVEPSEPVRPSEPFEPIEPVEPIRPSEPLEA